MLIQLLNLNKLAVEESCRLAWRADQEKWAHLGYRIRRQETGLDIHTLFREFPPAEVDGLIKKLKAAKDAADKRAAYGNASRKPGNNAGASSSKDCWRKKEERASDRHSDTGTKGDGKGAQGRRNDKGKGQESRKDQDHGHKKKFPHQMK